MQTIYKYISGSRLYGISLPNSDIDIRGVFIADIKNYLGLNNIKSFKLKENDEEYYEIRHYFKLLIDNNPNIIESLFVDSSNTLVQTNVSDRILDNYKIFLDKDKIYEKFIQYANSQKKKMIMRSDKYNDLKTALDFLINLPNNKIKIIDVLSYGRTIDVFNVSGDIINIGDMSVSRYDSVNTAIRKIKRRLDKFSNRKDLISKYGYDTKFANHLIRLLIEGIELLTIGKIEFPLLSSPTLIAIRNGKYTVDEVIDMANKYEKEFEIAYSKTKIGKANFNLANNMLIDILKDML